MTEKILLLGGTREARMIAGLLAKRDDCTAILSLAGVTSSPPDTGLEKRIGGFGGAEKMAAWMQDEAITTLIDATHPYAARISANAAWAAEKTGTRRLCLSRPQWQPEDGDQWQEFDDWDSLAAVIPDGAKVLLTAGQDGITALAAAGAMAGGGQNRFELVARALENPDKSAGITFIKGLPGKQWQDEAALLTQHAITHLVAKNSGGTSSRAKLVAARHLGVPVLLLARPAPPPPPLYEDVETLMQAL